jgi:hypothetical protein
MLLPDDFREFIALLISEETQFVMIGGYAYNLYLNPRATGDIDFFIECSPENEKRLRQVLERFGFGSVLPPESKPLLQPGKILTLGQSPLRIDLLTKIDGVTFDEVQSTCKIFQIDDLPIPVISSEKLIKNKLAAARPKDLVDAAELQKNKN